MWKVLAWYVQVAKMQGNTSITLVIIRLGRYGNLLLPYARTCTLTLTQFDLKTRPTAYLGQSILNTLNLQKDSKGSKKKSVKEKTQKVEPLYRYPAFISDVS